MKTLQTRLQAAVIAVALVVVVAIVVVVKTTVETIVVENESDKARQTLDMAMMAIRMENASYTYYHQKLLEERRNGLKSILENALAGISYAHSLFTRGEMTEIAAKDLALETVRQMRYANGAGYIWVQDCTLPIPNMLMHSAIPEIEGGPGVDQRFYDALDGKKNLLTEFVQQTQNGPAYVSYKWPKPTAEGLTTMQPKLSYLARFNPWGWLVGTGLYIDDIQKICNKHRQEMLASNMQFLKNIQLMTSGYIHIFDSKGTILLHPHLPAGKNANHILTPETGKPLLKEIMAASRTPEKQLKYKWQKTGKPENKLFRKVAYVRHLKSLDWYIVASIYEDELRAPARKLTRQIILISGVLILIAIILCGGLVRSIVRPLKRLADSALRIQTQGVDDFNCEELQVKGTREVEVLGMRLHQLMDSLRQEKQRLDATFNSIGDAVIATDADGRVMRMNPVAEKLTAWSLHEAVGRPLSDVFTIIHAKTGKQVVDPVQKVLDTDQLIETGDTAVLVDREGREYHINDSGAPIHNDQGDIIGVVLVFRDVTEERAIQEKLRQTQKMEAVGVLAGGVAHDFNNMLGGILGAAELVAGDSNDPRTREYISVILESTQRAAELAAKLLSFSRRQPVASIPFSVHKIVTNTIEIVNKDIGQKIVVKSDLNAEKRTVIGDPTLLQSAFLNLVENATQAMPEGGQLTFHSRVIELPAKVCAASIFNLTPGPHIEVTVSDTGCGIDSDHLNRIFEPFFTTKSHGTATGLGLAACYGIIQQHKGAIYVESEVGKGTAVHIMLPLVPKDEAAPQSSREIKEGEGTILLVDDEPVIRFTGKAILERYGYKVLLAENGEEAVSKYTEHGDSIDVVVCDMIMPKMNGRDCFHAIKTINPRIKFIIVSGFTQNNNTDEMEKQGLAAFIKKPFHAADFIHIVQEVLES